MVDLIHELIRSSAQTSPGANALLYREEVITYATLYNRVTAAAAGYLKLGLLAGERVAVYLPKSPRTVTALFGASTAGGVFVPVNTVLKPEQVGYILRDCNVRILVTSPERAATLAEVLAVCPDLRQVVLTSDGLERLPEKLKARCVTWDALTEHTQRNTPQRIDLDIAAILYTSGSTGNPKGVVLSHRNLVAGASSVSEYLENTAEDCLLAVLPLSFDYGLSQLTTAFSCGASVVLMDYLLPRDVLRAVTKYRVTGLAAVPPLWSQLAALEWPAEVGAILRYATNSGGAMPRATLSSLRAAMPDTRFYLMYGLTEAFRSTYLPPGEIDTRPASMGKAIPNVEVMVVREDGSECAPGEPGELVHRGSLVSLGYWNDPDNTAIRFKPAPGQAPGLPIPELAVWSGDQVRRDEDDYLYFISRKDDMIKTSGYRVSPTEVEDVVYGHGGIAQAAAVGIPHPMLGQAIVLIAQAAANHVSEQSIMEHCRERLPQYMLPAKIYLRDTLPKNPNGKLDRPALYDEFIDMFNAS